MKSLRGLIGPVAAGLIIIGITWVGSPAGATGQISAVHGGAWRLDRPSIHMSTAGSSNASPVPAPGMRPATTRLPLSSFSGMAIDDAHLHVFLSGGDADNMVVVTDLSGAIVTTYTGMANPFGVAISGSTHTAYVVECASNAIQAIDTVTLALGPLYPLGSGVCPSSPVIVGKRVWFSSHNGIGSLVPSTGKVKLFSGSDYPLQSELAAVPGNNRLLVAASANMSPTTLYRYKIKGKTGKLVLSQQVFDPGGAGITSQIAVTRDGADVLLASISPNYIQAFRVADLTSDGTYDTGDIRNGAVVTSPTSDLIFGGIDDSGKQNDIFVFHRGTSTPFNQLATEPDGDKSLWFRGLGTTHDDSLLFAVVSPSIQQAPIDLIVFPEPAKARSSLTLLANPPDIQLGKSTQLSGQLTFADGDNAGGKTIHIVRDNPDGSQTNLADATTNTSGQFSEADTPPVAGSFVYEAHFQGDDSHAGSDASTTVDVSADGKIAFDSNRTGNFEIFTINADGSSVHQLTNNSADDFGPAWSPDGSQIAFASDRGGNYDIWLMNADGTGLKNVTNNAAFDAYPSWSPNGATLAFESDRSGNVDIWTVDLPAGTVHRRTATPAADELPSWSPDGTHIVFDSDRTGDFDVFTMKSDGSAVTNVTNNSASDGGATYSPDGTKIAFGSDRSGNFEIWTYAIADGTLTRLTNSSGFDGNQSFAPGGDRLAFESDRNGHTQIWVMNADGTGVKQYTKTGTVNELADWGTAP